MRNRLSYGDGNPVALWDTAALAVDLCVVTLLQFWFINSGVVDDEVATHATSGWFIVGESDCHREPLIDLQETWTARW
jgi:hypothetical protein